MFDFAPSAPAWSHSVQVGDIVSFRFPVEKPSGPQDQPKKRPGLVLAIRRLDGRATFKLALGSGAKLDRPGIHLLDPEEIAAASLRKPTRFDLSRIITAAEDDPRFCISGRIGTPTLGRLPAPGRPHPDSPSHRRSPMDVIRTHAADAIARARYLPRMLSKAAEMPVCDPSFFDGAAERLSIHGILHDDVLEELHDLPSSSRTRSRRTARSPGSSTTTMTDRTPATTPPSSATPHGG